MDAPQFPDGFLDAAFDFPNPGEDGYPADLYNFNEEVVLPLQEEDQNAVAAAVENEQGKLGHTAQKEGAKVITRRRRLKKAIIDDPQNMTISNEEYKSYTIDWSDLVISRPRKVKRERPELFSLGPASGPWPKELMYLWERSNDRFNKPFPLKTPEGEGGKRGSKRGKRVQRFFLKFIFYFKI